MELGSAARDETEEFSLCQLAECARTVWFEKLGNRAQQMKADVFIEGWRRRLIGYEHQRSVEQTERIEYFSDSLTLRSCARFSGTILAQRKGRTRKQWEHALMLARARASDDCPLISSELL
jgi:hypothetical protein